MSVGKNSATVLSCLWTKVHEILRQRRRPFVLSNALADCLCHVLFSRYSPISLEVVENQTNVKGFWPQFFSGGTTSTVLQQVVSATYCPPFAKVWLSSVCWSPSANLRSLTMKENAEFTGFVKMLDRVLSRLWTKVHDILGPYRRSLVNALNRLSIPCFIPNI